MVSPLHGRYFCWCRKCSTGTASVGKLCTILIECKRKSAHYLILSCTKCRNCERPRTNCGPVWCICSVCPGSAEIVLRCCIWLAVIRMEVTVHEQNTFLSMTMKQCRWIDVYCWSRADIQLLTWHCLGHCPGMLGCCKICSRWVSELTPANRSLMEWMTTLCHEAEGCDFLLWFATDRRVYYYSAEINQQYVVWNQTICAQRLCLRQLWV